MSNGAAPNSEEILAIKFRWAVSAVAATTTDNRQNSRSSLVGRVYILSLIDMVTVYIPFDGVVV